MKLVLGKHAPLDRRWTRYQSFDGLEDEVGKCMGPFEIYDWVERMLMGLAWSDFIFEMRQYFGERVWPYEVDVGV